MDIYKLMMKWGIQEVKINLLDYCGASMTTRLSDTNVCSKKYFAGIFGTQWLVPVVFAWLLPIYNCILRIQVMQSSRKNHRRDNG